jgi:hypothetical protein
VFSFGDDIRSVVTAAVLKDPDGSVHREGGRLRTYFAAVDFPGGTYRHDLYQTTGADGLTWAKPTLVMANAYAPCVIKEGARYRMWYTCKRRQTRGPGVRREPGRAGLDQAPGQPGVPAGAQARLGVELHHQPVPPAAAGRDLPAVVCRPQAAAVE